MIYAQGAKQSLTLTDAEGPGVLAGRLGSHSQESCVKHLDLDDFLTAPMRRETIARMV